MGTHSDYYARHGAVAKRKRCWCEPPHGDLRCPEVVARAVKRGARARVAREVDGEVLAAAVPLDQDYCPVVERCDCCGPWAGVYQGDVDRARQFCTVDGWLDDLVDELSDEEWDVVEEAVRSAG